MDDTNSRPEESSKNVEENPVPPNIFIVMEGIKAIPLDMVCVSIGRSLDNRVIVDDPRVSRHHVEIRVIDGNFVLFDLKSSGGTFLNGRRTQQAILYPGDLISLAGVNFVFTRDTRLAGRGTDEFAPAGPGKRNTVIFNNSTDRNKYK